MNMTQTKTTMTAVLTPLLRSALVIAKKKKKKKKKNQMKAMMMTITVMLLLLTLLLNCSLFSVQLKRSLSRISVDANFKHLSS
jgi:hypothetical protein